MPVRPSIHRRSFASVRCALSGHPPSDRLGRCGFPTALLHGHADAIPTKNAYFDVGWIATQSQTPGPANAGFVGENEAVRGAVPGC